MTGEEQKQLLDVVQAHKREFERYIKSVSITRYIQIMNEVMLGSIDSEEGLGKLFNLICKNPVAKSECYRVAKKLQGTPRPVQQDPKTGEMLSDKFLMAAGDRATDWWIDANIAKWLEYKQVYKFDDVFLNELNKTEETVLSKGTLEHLPYDSFGLDLSSSSSFVERTGIKAAIVTVVPVDERWFMVMEFFPRETAAQKMGESHFSMTVVESEVPITRFMNWDGKATGLKETLLNEAVFTIGQCVAYMSSIEPDMEKREPPLPKDAAAPKPAKTAFEKSRVTENEVGFKIGNAYREYYARLEKEQASGGAGIKRAISPHSVRGHYHGYWYGKKGEPKEFRKRWVAPYFVNARTSGDIDKIQPTIHNVEKEQPSPKKANDGIDH